VLLVKDIITFLEEKFPPSLAYDWDNVGLQIGDLDRKIKRIMVALDATTSVINEAINKEVDFIITHHPFIFSSLKSIDLGTPQGKNIQKLIKNDIAIYTMHTNYDVAPGGMNDVLAEQIGLQSVKPFAMIDEVYGLGRIGELENPMNIECLSDMIRLEKLKNEVGDIKTVETVGSGVIKKVAIIGGSGGKYIHEAKALGADVFITGDVTYHTAIDAMDIGLNMLDIGHYAEVIMEEKVALLLDKQFADDVRISQPSVSRNPII
jgi:dinuclear metal center YbgI/SA1388 family protein